MHNIASLRDEEGEKQGLGLDLEKVLVVVREIVDTLPSSPGSLPDMDGFQLSLRSSSPHPRTSAAGFPSAN
jgi:hypothetical protein